MNEPHCPDGLNSPADYEQFFQESLCGFLVADEKGEICQANARMAGWLGCDATQVNGRRFSDLLTIGGKIYFETHLWPLLRMQGFFDEVLLELRSETGEKMRVLTNARECRDQQNQVYAIHFTVLKARDRIQYEQNLQQLKEAAERELTQQKELVSLREQLIAVLGHDLRNPLNAVLLVADLLPETAAGPTFNNMLGTLKRSGHRMKELIYNIMDFARSRMGEGILIAWQEVELAPLLQQVVEELQLMYPNRNLQMDFHLPQPVYCDPDRICQLLSNLLANAITHGHPQAPVLVQASQGPQGFELSVSNSGEPIPQELHEQLFNPFVKESKRSSQNGLGLGLYIAAEIARSHHAKLRFTSDEVETRFVLQVPVQGER